MAISPFSLTDDPRGLDALAADGAIITVRLARPDDRSALTGLYGDGPGSLSVRLLTGADQVTSSAEIEMLCLPEGGRHLTLIALDGAELVGAGCCGFLGRRGDIGEIAVLVAEAHHGRGIGTLLLDHLVARARRAGVTRFLGDALPGNSAVVRRSGGLVPDAALDLSDIEVVQRAVAARDRTAGEISLRALLSPRSVAVIGAMQRRGTTGFEVVRALRDYGFRGHLYPVNGSGRPVCGIPGRRSISCLPQPVDLLVVAAPPEQVPRILCEAGSHGTRSAVVLSRGITGGPAGRRRREELRMIAAEYGVRLLGPASLGVLNTDPQVRLNAGLSPARPLTGGLAVAAQSSAVGIALLEHTARNGCGIAGFVSLGDLPDVGCDELLTYWYTDARTRAIALHLDSFGDPRAFARTARALARRKPLLAIAGGVAGDDGLFGQAGIIGVSSLDEMVDTARILVDQPLPSGNRLGIVGNAGGLATLAAGIARSGGFALPPLSARVRRQLPAGSGNPVDLGADATPQEIADAVDVVAGSGEVDVLLVMIVGTRTNVPSAIMTTLAGALEACGALTTAVVLAGSSDDIHRLGAHGTPVYRQPDRALRALAHAVRYARWRREPLGRRAGLGGIEPQRAEKLIAAASSDGQDWVPRPAAVDILAAYGIAVLPAARARNGVSAVAAAERLGYPVVLISDPGRSGTTRRGLHNATAVRESFEGPEVLVQHQVTAPMELAASITQDPVFGPVVGMSTGVERLTRILPVTDADARRMWSHLGHRSPVVNAGAIEDLLLRLGCLAENHPEIAQLDLNPLLAGENGVVAANVRLRLFTDGQAP